VVFFDTSAIFALADERDKYHHQAELLVRQALAAGEGLLVHSYLIVEAASLLQRRLSLAAATAFLRSTDRLAIHWVSPEEHREAALLLAERQRRTLSLVDCTSFVVMRRLGLTQVLAFDGDFDREGFALYPAES
jgi:predicted nucleic acid-binding protein